MRTWNKCPSGEKTVSAMRSCVNTWRIIIKTVSTDRDRMSETWQEQDARVRLSPVRFTLLELDLYQSCSPPRLHCLRAPTSPRIISSVHLAHPFLHLLMASLPRHLSRHLLSGYGRSPLQHTRRLASAFLSGLLKSVVQKWIASVHRTAIGSSRCSNSRCVLARLTGHDLKLARAQASALGRMRHPCILGKRSSYDSANAPSERFLLQRWVRGMIVCALRRKY